MKLTQLFCCRDAQQLQAARSFMTVGLPGNPVPWRHAAIAAQLEGRFPVNVIDGERAMLGSGADADRITAGEVVQLLNSQARLIWPVILPGSFAPCR